MLALIAHKIPISTHMLLFTSHHSLLIARVLDALHAHTLNELLIATQPFVAPPSQISGNPQLITCATFLFYLTEDLPFVVLTQE